MSETREQLLDRIGQLEKALETQTQRNSHRELDALVFSLMKRPTANAEEAARALAKYDRTICEGPVFVLAAEFGAEVLLTKKDVFFAHFLVKNMLDDLFGQGRHVLYTCSGSVLYCIVNAGPSALPSEEETDQAGSLIVQTLEEQAGFTCVLYLSEPRKSITQLHTAYEEVEALRQYRRFVQTTVTVMHFHAFLRGRHQEQLPQLRELRQSLQLRKYDQALRQAGDVLDQLQTGDILGVDTYESQLYHILNPVLDRLSEAMQEGEVDPDKGLALCRALRQADSMEQLRAAVLEALESLEREHTELEQNAPSWMNALMEQLNNGFRNPQLSVNYLADQIGITPVHLSRVFRRIQGVGLMDYIHQLRVDAAKQLIMQGCSVKHAMSLVGYSNPLTMSRAFKKLDGSTPGQYAPTGKLSS
jgi:YesN/AraC family two-component response regulator